jgi:catechol 2,3-dioxygenase-like lactoylglutathione lyase family enzyme
MPRMEVRFARHTERLPEIVRFYGDGLGLPELGRFEDHAGYDGVFFGLPGTDAHLEFTSGGRHAAPSPHPETLLVLYVGDAETVDAMRKRVGTEPVEPANPYWRSRAVTVDDPDGFGVVLVPRSAPTNLE